MQPIPRPRKAIFGIGSINLDHVIEFTKALDTNKHLPEQPVVLSKLPTCVIGPGDAIEHNAAIPQQLDWRSGWLSSTAAVLTA